MSDALLCRQEYERRTAASRDSRMAWFREARFGMFIHYGLYALEGRNEWVQAVENIPIEEYEKLAEKFKPKPGAAREWAALAKKAGMKYAVLTTRHHEGFSLWDSKVNPFNSVRLGPKRDLVREFVDACREHGLRIGFYSSLMDWHHPDAWRAAFDTAARKRFTDYIRELNRELLTQYGKIDILWYDVSAPMESWEGWDSLELNQMVRSLQPDIIINNRSKLPEDLGTPEGHITAEERDWEACMTFNDISWGYVDAAQAAPYAYTPQRIVKMLNTATSGKGNLLLNIGPAPDGSVPADAVEPLTKVGQWLSENGPVAYGVKEKSGFRASNGVCGNSCQGNTVYFWNWIWPSGGEMAIGGFATPVKSIKLVKDGTPIRFEQKGQRILLKGLPPASPDKILGIATFAIEFTDKPVFHRCSYYPQLHGGMDWAEGRRL
jgi:alpha-L-fucosidase